MIKWRSSAFGTILLSALIGIAFCTLRFPNISKNWDNPNLETFLREKRSASIYLDGARPYFVQRSSPDSILFYDLNSRLRQGAPAEALCPIAQCFRPQLWVITRHQKSHEEFVRLRNHFGGIIFDTEQSFVATHFDGHCPPTEPDATSCKDLKRLK